MVILNIIEGHKGHFIENRIVRYRRNAERKKKVYLEGYFKKDN